MLSSAGFSAGASSHRKLRIASSRCASWLAISVNPTTSGMIPSALRMRALRATRQWHSRNARVTGANRLPIPQSRLVPNARITIHTSPATISTRPPRINNASIPFPCLLYPECRRRNPSPLWFVDLEVCSRRGDRFGLGGLRCGDGNIRHAPALTPDLTLRIGVTIMTGAQVIYREIDDFRQMRNAREHQQVQHCRMLHEAGNDAAMDRRQHRIANG